MTVFKCRDCSKWFWWKLTSRHIPPLGHRFLYRDDYLSKEYKLKPFGIKFEIRTIFRCVS